VPEATDGTARRRACALARGPSPPSPPPPSPPPRARPRGSETVDANDPPTHGTSEPLTFDRRRQAVEASDSGQKMPMKMASVASVFVGWLSPATPRRVLRGAPRSACRAGRRLGTCATTTVPWLHRSTGALNCGRQRRRLQAPAATRPHLRGSWSRSSRLHRRTGLSGVRQPSKANQVPLALRRHQRGLAPKRCKEGMRFLVNRVIPVRRAPQAHQERRAASQPEFGGVVEPPFDRFP
jgi:hypothetical protein